MQPIHVLIADDDCFQRALVRMLVVHAYPAAIVAEAYDGQDALTHYATKGADLVITDVHMPVLGGITLTHTIRSQSHAVPIIVISGEPDTKAAAQQAGASQWIAKSVLLTRLPQVLAEILPSLSSTTIAGCSRPRYQTPTMRLIAGQHVIWTFRPQRPRQRPYAVAAEVVQVSRLRVRIRVCTASGKRMQRWVHPKNLRAREPDETAALYPDQP